MSIVLADLGKVKLLEQERAFLNTCELRLYTNSSGLSQTSVAADMVEPVDSGYGPLPVAFASAVLDGSHNAVLVGTPQVWTFAHNVANFTIFGYWLKDPVSGILVYFDPALAPFTVSTSGQTYTVAPRKAMNTM